MIDLVNLFLLLLLIATAFALVVGSLALCVIALNLRKLRVAYKANATLVRETT